jgi:hypothetical protein
MNSKFTHLDRLAAQQAQAVIANTNSSSVENSVTKALGVLQENGVYACFLYLLAKEKDNGKEVVDKMLELLLIMDFGSNKPDINNPEDVLAYIIDNVTVDLERLLLAKEILEQMLIYARYSAKAHQKQAPENAEDEVTA